MIVQYVDGKEQHNVHNPPAQGNFGWGEKQRRSRPVKLRNVACHCYEAELNECQQRACYESLLVLEPRIVARSWPETYHWRPHNCHACQRLVSNGLTSILT